MDIIFILATILAVYYSVYTFRKYRGYKKLDLSSEVILKEDNKIYRIIGPLIIIFAFSLGSYTLFLHYTNDRLTVQNVLSSVMNIAFFVALYLPFSIRPTVSDHGIYKNGTMIRWEQIATIEHKDATSTRRLQTVIYYKSSTGKRVATNILFDKNTENYEEFKTLENRNMPKNKKMKK